MKQIFWPRTGGAFLIFLIFSLKAGSGLALDQKGEGRIYQIIGPGISSPAEWSRVQLESLGAETIPSAYFDKALDYHGSWFSAISMKDLVRRFDPGGLSDAVLLNCFDDYQGILSVEDIKRYDLRLATRIEIRPEFKQPGWLNPLMVIVPDGMSAPFQERFLTANIRELKFTQLEDYYRPLEKVGKFSASSVEGLNAFKNNCLFCHSLMGIGGDKGVRLVEEYDFSSAKGKAEFQDDFLRFHQKDNPDKQNVEQFVTKKQLRSIGQFLMGIQQSRGKSDEN